MKRVLIIRFSSLGDIAQCLTVLEGLRHRWPEAEIHWVVRSDFAALLRAHPQIDHLWELKRRDGLRGLFRLARQLRAQNFSFIYDAHNNLRSHLLRWWLGARLTQRPQWAVRSKYRIKRWLLFRWRVHLLPKPFRGAKSFLEPLKRWGISSEPRSPSALKLPPLPFALPQKYVVLAPSAAWELKRWPVNHWRKLIAQFPDHCFVIVGGKEDLLCGEIAQEFDADKVQNRAGQLSWLETTALIAGAQLVVSGDTGALHLADYLARRTVALIGPTAFGYPSRPDSHVLETPLACRPCSKDGRGQCHNSVYQLCMTSLHPQQVAQLMENLR